MKQLALPGTEPRPWWGRSPGDERRACGMCLVASTREEAAQHYERITGHAPGVVLSDAEFDAEWPE